MREFAIALDAPVTDVLDRCAAEIGAGYPLAREYPEYENGLLVAITERRSRRTSIASPTCSPGRSPICAARGSRRGSPDGAGAHHR